MATVDERDETVIPIFASLSLSEDVVNDLTGHGIDAMGEETMALLNYEQVQARDAGA